jgi:chromosome partitioning protein
VSELLGLSRKALERAIEEGKIPGGTVAHGRRMFTLGKIHIIKGRLGVRLWRDPKTGPPAVVAVVNFKGGVSKTSTAVHLGPYLALKGYRTLMIGSDAHGSLTT